MKVYVKGGGEAKVDAPATATNGNIAVFDDSGKAIKDGGWGFRQVFPYGSYNFPDGLLIGTDIPSTEDAMFRLEIIGNGCTTNKTLHIVVEGYSYNTSDSIIYTHGVALDYVTDIYAFIYNGRLHFWLASPANYTSIFATCYKTQDSLPYNRVNGTAHMAKPSSISREVVIKPKVLGAGQIIYGSGLDTTLNAGETRYMGLGLHTNPWYRSIIIPIDGIFSNLKVYSSGAPGANQSYTYTVMVNNVAQAITCTTSGDTTNTSSDTSHTCTVPAGARICVRVVASAGAIQSSSNLFALMFTPTA